MLDKNDNSIYISFCRILVYYFFSDIAIVLAKKYNLLLEISCNIGVSPGNIMFPVSSLSKYIS
jgi:hypothetical protein